MDLLCQSSPQPFYHIPSQQTGNTSKTVPRSCTTSSFAVGDGEAFWVHQP